MKSLLVSLACLAAVLLTACGNDTGLATPKFAPSISASSDPTLPPNVVALAPGQLTNTQYADEADRTPSGSEIRAALPVLERWFATLELSPTLRPFGAYYLQVAGLRGGRTAVNALCDVDRMSWRTTWVTVNDGGDCYWHAVVDDGRIETVAFNGNA